MGVHEFLFVYGDRPETGARSDDLTVKTMIKEARQFAERAELIWIATTWGYYRPSACSHLEAERRLSSGPGHLFGR